MHFGLRIATYYPVSTIVKQFLYTALIVDRYTGYNPGFAAP